MGSSPHARRGETQLGGEALEEAAFGPRYRRMMQCLNGGSDDRDLHAALNDACTDGVAGETCGVVDAELLHEIVPVLFDRFDADIECCCDLLVGRAFGNPLEYLHLT